MKFTLLAQPLLAASALAAPTAPTLFEMGGAIAPRDLASVQGALTQVQTSLDALGTAVDGVSATDPNTLQAVLSASMNTQGTLSTATQTINASPALTLTDSLTLQQSATGLTNSANKTITSLIAKKPVLDQLGVSSVVATQLQTQKTGSKALGDAIVSKVPAAVQGIAQQSIAPIDAGLDQAITVYSG